MIVLFTDFGLAGPYTGQMKAVLHRHAPGVPVVDLMADAPTYNPHAAAFLLDAYAGPPFVPGSVYLCVVDPGVGGARRPVVVETERGWFVGPDNGLFERVARTAEHLRCWEITWRPEHLSASFHGRDLFAPVAARLANGEEVPGEEIAADTVVSGSAPDSLAEVIYIDHFGNAMTGIPGAAARPGRALQVRGMPCPPARTFSDVPEGEPLWYINSNGLVEIAVNRGRADQVLGLAPGEKVDWV